MLGVGPFAFGELVLTPVIWVPAGSYKRTVTSA
jgi:hypothetical protein